jgi:hypothetical protein
MSGSENVALLGQFDNNELAHLTITGDKNFVVGGQAGGSTVGNDIEVQITGDGNNTTSGGVPGASFTAGNKAAMLAASAYTVGDLLSALGSNAATFSGLIPTGYSSASVLMPGALLQDGDNNKITVNVGQNVGLYGGDNTGNLFAVLQVHDNNTLVANVNGSGNQFAVVQNGDQNYSNLTQTGTGNVAAISQ